MIGGKDTGSTDSLSAVPPRPRRDGRIGCPGSYFDNSPNTSTCPVIGNMSITRARFNR